MGKLTTVNHHQGALSVRSHSCDMCLQSIATCHCLGIGDDVGDICFVLIHPVYDKTQVLVLKLLTLPPVLSILLPLTPWAQQQTSANFINHLKTMIRLLLLALLACYSCCCTLVTIQMATNS